MHSASIKKTLTPGAHHLPEVAIDFDNLVFLTKFDNSPSHGISVHEDTSYTALTSPRTVDVGD